MAELVVMQPSFFTEVAALLTDERLPAWRAWAKWRLISSLVAVPVECLRGRALRLLRDRAVGHAGAHASAGSAASALVEGALGEAVGKVYVERHFSPVAKERMDALVANLIEAYRRSITDLDWMTDETKDAGAGQAGQVPAAHRLSDASGATTAALEIDARRPDRQRDAGRRASSWTARWPRSASRSTARSG